MFGVSGWALPCFLSPTLDLCVSFSIHDAVFVVWHDYLKSASSFA